MPKKVTGIGGIFFRSNDPAKAREWYATHLGLSDNQWGSVFDWREADSDKKGFHGLECLLRKFKAI